MLVEERLDGLVAKTTLKASCLLQIFKRFTYNMEWFVNVHERCRLEDYSIQICAIILLNHRIWLTFVMLKPLAAKDQILLLVPWMRGLSALVHCKFNLLPQSACPLSVYFLSESLSDHLWHPPRMSIQSCWQNKSSPVGCPQRFSNGFFFHRMALLSDEIWHKWRITSVD